MAVDQLDFGDSLAGLLVDGVDEQPYVAAVLKMTREEGIVLEVPYHDAAAEFAHVATWFGAHTPPANLVLQTSGGDVSLFDLQFAGRAMSMGTGSGIGRLAPRATVLGPRTVPVNVPLALERVASRLDGLNLWTGLQSEERQADADGEGRTQQMTVTLRSPNALSWRQGDATLTLRSSWQTVSGQDGYERHTSVSDNVVVESTFDDGPRPFADHFVEQRKLATLLRLLYGRPISFRRHEVRDGSFAVDIGTARPYVPTLELISTATVRERERPIPTQGELGLPIAFLGQLGPDALAAWSDNYDAWSRFILPAAAIFGRAEPFIEDVVNSTNMAMEAAGQHIGFRSGEDETYSGKRTTTATYVYRCLDLLGLDWGDRIDGTIGLARAVANSYNTIKHPDRGAYPDITESAIVARVGRLIVRLLALHVAGSDALLKELRDARDVLLVRQDLIDYGLRVDHDGNWIRDQ
ncbi:hypothetical protein [Microbacterium capsulatum]|uniref:ApeA N-terminal domain-containing protein n=1 Tax=Microbacterium capsulatum TaxID=3041921 RepID=A0ABU0XFQ7_9MICO|nr:hypothetical protein [Microbacterium sp. ASV81]MDQ4213742.1 hypothetical protein [Microbacterium sp. ASV81]